jgi:hypothetical protein
MAVYAHRQAADPYSIVSSRSLKKRKVRESGVWDLTISIKAKAVRHGKANSADCRADVNVAHLAAIELYSPRVDESVRFFTGLLGMLEVKRNERTLRRLLIIGSSAVVL